jgi:hypothetical protein
LGISEGEQFPSSLICNAIVCLTRIDTKQSVHFGRLKTDTFYTLFTMSLILLGTASAWFCTWIHQIRVSSNIGALEASLVKHNSLLTQKTWPTCWEELFTYSFPQVNTKVSIKAYKIFSYSRRVNIVPE